MDSADTSVDAGQLEEHDDVLSLRSHLRKDFLKLLSSLHKKQVQLHLYECSLPLTATFEACQPSLQHFLVSNLQTPIGRQKWAIIRTSDVVELHFDIDDFEKTQ